MFSSIRKSFLGFLLLSLLLLFPLFYSSCAGLALSISSGRIFGRTSSYYYFSYPYAYIEGYRFYVYAYPDDPYVIYLDVPYHITIYSDGRVYAPRALIILLD